MSATDLVAEFTSMLEHWNEEIGGIGERHQTWTGDGLLQKLKRLAEIIEIETEAYYKLDLDPFDDRHPDRAHPNSGLGKCLKLLSKNDRFMNELVGTYLMRHREDVNRQTISCRLLLDVMPGVEPSILFQETDGLTAKLFEWAEMSDEPLRTYATGLLAVAIKLPEIAAEFREKNAHLVPIMLTRLHTLQQTQLSEKITENDKRYFSVVSSHKIATDNNESKPGCSSDVKNGEQPTLSSFKSTSNLNISPYKSSSNESSPIHTSPLSTLKRALSPRYFSEDLLHTKRMRCDTVGNYFPEYSNSSWSEMEHYIVGSYSMEPLNITMKQRIILQYLIPMGEYQELMGHAFEFNAMTLIFFYIDLKENRDVRLAFEALKYLATLLCHKKFAIDFLQHRGIEKLIEVNRPSIAATGVSLCLYFMSYFEDALERVCLLPEHILFNLVEYALWLLECSHDSSRIHAAMFFGQMFPFKVMLDIFDQQNGLRTLFNAISTLQLLNIDANSENTSEDYVYTMRQTARHVCAAMKRYFEAHMVMKAEEIKRSHERCDENHVNFETAAFKAVKISEELFEEHIEMLSLFFPIRSYWTPVSTFQQLGGIQLLLQLISMAPDWTQYPGKPETVRSALDVIAVCTVTPRAQAVLLESISLPNDNSSPGIGIVISMAEGESMLVAPDVQRSALTVIVNCVCGPIDRFGGGVGRFMGSGSKKKLNSKAGEDMLTRMWNALRTNNGVMALLKLLSVKTPITDADAVRALACKALVGLSRSETLRQIISKLPIFNNGQLQTLMKEPVLQDKRLEHIKFCKYASELLEKVSGKQSKCFSASLEEIRRSDIVSQTKIIFQEKELLQLICGHLMSNGYMESANMLRKEAKLPSFSPSPVVHISTPNLFSPSTSRINRQISASSSISAPSLSAQQSPVGPNLSQCVTPGPIKFTLGKHVQTNELNTPKTTHSQSKTQVKHFRDKENNGSVFSYQNNRVPGKSINEYDVSLDKIVTEYLRKQHALCPNPVVTCPPMSLFSPHQCPEPRGRQTAPVNFTMRLLNRPVFPTHGGLQGAKFDRKFIYSRFRPVKTYKDNDDDGYACCALTPCERYLLLGTFSGEIKMSNIYTEDMGMYSCHNSPVIHLDPARDGKLLLTSTWGTMQDSSLWAWTDDSLENKFTFDDTYAEFSKLTQDKIIGTKDETAHVYDTFSGQIIATLYDVNKANNYKSNIATFSPTDDLILNDGVLWDLRQSKVIHKFDKFNPSISGVFHPSGLEIIINSEVWDVRTFHLLHTVPSLDQCQIQFNYSGNVIYATHFDEDPDPEEDRHRSPYSSTLRTFDSYDYTSIGTKDLKTKSIFDLSTDKSDCLLAVVENQKFSENSGEESICRLYEVGKRRDDEEDQLEDEDEKAAEEDDDDDDDEDDDLGDDNVITDEDLGELELDDDDDDDFEEGDDEDEDDDDDDFNANNVTSENSDEDDDALFEIV